MSDAEKAAEKWANRVAYGDLSEKYLPSAPGNNFDDYSCAYDSFLAGAAWANQFAEWKAEQNGKLDAILAKAVTEQVVEMTPKWISVREKTPEDDQTVLVWAEKAQEVQMADVTNGKLRTIHDHLITSTLQLTHWMPLPDAPKEEK